VAEPLPGLWITVSNNKEDIWVVRLPFGGF
jgi:hypothetical protein